MRGDAPDWGLVFGVVFMLVFLALFGWLILMAYRGYNRAARYFLMRAYRGIDLHHEPAKRDVHLVFHTYHGLLLWFVQTEHNVHLSPEQALLLLRRLNRFNLTWGLLSYGALFIPLISLGNYMEQKRSIQTQACRVDA